MEVQEILECLTMDCNKYQRKTVDEAIKHRKEIIPSLIGILKDVLENPNKFIDDQTLIGHDYALILLGHFKEKSVHELILKLFSLPDDMPHRLYGAIVTENLPVLLLNTCDGNFDGIKKLVLNEEADEYCRSSALRAIAYGVANDTISREEVLKFYKNILENRKPEQPNILFNSLAVCACDLYPEELIELLKICYDEGYIIPGYIRFESIETALKAGKEVCLKKLKNNLEFDSPEDIHKAISWRECFSDSEIEDDKYKESKIDISPFFPTTSNKSADSKKKKNKRKMSKASKRKNRKKK